MDQCSSQCKTLINCSINQRGYTQLLNQYTTDYHTQIDHIYTNVPNDVQSVGVLESYYVTQFYKKYETKDKSNVLFFVHPLIHVLLLEKERTLPITKQGKLKSSEHNKMEDRNCESTRIGQSKPSNNSQSEPLDFDPSVTSSLI